MLYGEIKELEEREHGGIKELEEVGAFVVPAESAGQGQLFRRGES
jgi:hypothetical protein